MQELWKAAADSQGYLCGVLLFACMSFFMVFYMHEMKRKERQLYNYIDKKLSSRGRAISNAIEANQISRNAVLSDEELQMLLTPCEKEQFAEEKEEKDKWKEEDDKLIEELLSEMLDAV